MVLTHAHPEQLPGFFLPSGPELELSHPPDLHVNSSPGMHPDAATAQKQHTINTHNVKSLQEVRTPTQIRFMETNH